MWGHPQSVSQSDASYNFYYIDVVTPDAYNSFMADPHFKDIFETGDDPFGVVPVDARRLIWVIASSASVPDQTGDIVVMRSAEMYLIAAEALAREGRLEDA